MTKSAWLVVAVAMVGCATTRRDIEVAERGGPAHPLYVGHGTSGEMVLAASHYDAMSGMAVAVADLGMKGESGEYLVCAREIPTGSHVPLWVCRAPQVAERNRQIAQDFLIQVRNCANDCEVMGENGQH